MAPMMENGPAGQLKLITVESLESYSYPRITLTYFPQAFHNVGKDKM